MTTSDRLALRLSVTFESDWHIGSGGELPGSLDRVVQRDSDELPYIPAKTLTGILRDSAEEVAAALGGNWPEWVAWLFGDEPTRQRSDDRSLARGRGVQGRPHAARLSIRPARLDATLRDAFAAVKERGAADTLREALFVSRAGVKIDDHGQAEARHLRIDEMVVGGLTLEADAVMDAAGLKSGQREIVMHLLAIAASQIERMGHKRRRGAGRVRVQLKSESLKQDKDLAIWLETHAEVDAPPFESTPHPAEAMSQPDIGGTWNRLEFQIRLLSSVLIAAKTVGNEVQSHDVIPGTMLLPIVTRALRGQANVSAAIRSGSLRVSNATLEIDGRRSDPMPAALHHRKEGHGGLQGVGCVRNALQESLGDYTKPSRGGYVVCNSDGTLPRYGKVDLSRRTHGTIDEQYQRPTTEVGGVFTYQTIATHHQGQREDSPSTAPRPQYFRGFVQWRSDLGVSPEQMRSALVGEHALGRSKKDDYGRIEITSLNISASTEKPIVDGRTLTIWLVSDLVLRTPSLSGSIALENVEQEIQRALHRMDSSRPWTAKADDLHTEDSNLREKPRLAAFLTYRRIDSWHVGWGLPRPTLMAVAAGSCLRVKLDRDVTPKQLAELEQEGLGLRQSEGFGQIRVNVPLLTSAVKDWNPATKQTVKNDDGTPSQGRSAASSAVLESLEHRAWQRAIRQAALTLSDAKHREELWGFTGNQPTRAQAGLLRMLLQLDRVPLVKRLEAIREHAQADDKGLSRRTLDRILEKLADEDTSLWLTLEDEVKLPVFDPIRKQRLQQRLRLHAVRSLLYAAIRAHGREERSGEVRRDPAVVS